MDDRRGSDPIPGLSSRHGRDRRTIAAESWLIVVVFVWAANYPLAKYALSGLNPLIFNSIRYIVATLVLTGFLALRKESWVRVERADLPRLLWAGLVAGIIYQVTFITGLSLTTAGNSAIILSTSPLWTIVFHARLHH